MSDSITPNIPKFNFDPTKIMNALPDDKPRQTPRVFLFGLLLVLLAGAGAAAYFYLVPQFTPPEMVLSKMQLAQAAVGSAHTTGHLRVALTREPVAAGAATQSETSDSPPASPVASESMVINLEVGGDTLYEPDHRLAQSWSLAAYGLPESPVLPSRINVKADVRLVGSDLYVRLREVPVLPAFDLDPWKSNWIKLTDGMTVDKLFSRPDLVTVTERLPLETLEGVETYHYRFTLNRPAFKSLVLDFLKLFEAASPAPLDTSSLEVTLDNLQLPQGEIWIGRRDNLIYRVTLAGNINKLEPTSSLKYFGIYSLDWSFANYNLPVKIDPPTTFVNLEQILNTPAIISNEGN